MVFEVLFKKHLIKILTLPYKDNFIDKNIDFGSTKLSYLFIKIVFIG